MKKIYGFLILLFGIIFLLALYDLITLFINDAYVKNYIDDYFGLKLNVEFSDMRHLEEILGFSLIKIYLSIMTFMSFLLSIIFFYWGYRVIRNK